MTRIVYYLPAAAGHDAAALAASGLADRLDGRAHSRETFAGPDGARGLILLHAEAPAEQCLYDPDRQRWARMPGSPAWFGIDVADPAGPAELARPEPVAGYLVRLGDGQDWLIPTARLLGGGTALPQALALGPDGQLVRTPLAAFAAACRDAERVWEALRADYGLLEEGEMPPAALEDLEAFLLAARALAINYRLGAPEAGALGLLTTRNVVRVLAAFVDLPTYLRVQAERAEAAAKKNGCDAPDGGPSASGPPG